ncbi:hypothetical protein BSKO_12891 [Bryopsis sp. KO-2023]|nr:hypothetical protein BSKO_12891 [Bryopsis sp. KO-2023]
MGAVEDMWERELLVKEACFQPWRRKSQLSKFAGALDAVLPELQRERKLTIEMRDELEALKNQQRRESASNATTVDISRAREIIRDSEARAAAAESTRRSEATSYEKLLAAEKTQKEDIRKQVVGLVEQQQRLLESLAKRDEEVMLASEEIDALKGQIDALQKTRCTPSLIQTSAQAAQTDATCPEIQQESTVSLCDAQVQTSDSAVLHNEVQTESVGFECRGTQCTQTDEIWEAVDPEQQQRETLQMEIGSIVVDTLEVEDLTEEPWVGLATTLLQRAKNHGKSKARCSAPSTVAQHLVRRRNGKRCFRASPTAGDTRLLRIAYFAWKRMNIPEAQSSPEEARSVGVLRTESGEIRSTSEEVLETRLDLRSGSTPQASLKEEALSTHPVCIPRAEEDEQTITAEEHPADDDLDGGNFPNIELVREFIDEVERKIGESKREGALVESRCADLRTLFSSLTKIVTENQSWCHLPLEGKWSESGTERSTMLAKLLKNKPPSVRFSCRRECVRQLYDLVGEIQGLLVALKVTSSEQPDVPVSCIEGPMAAMQISDPETRLVEEVTGRESEQELDQQVKDITKGLGRKEDSDPPLPEQLDMLDVAGRSHWVQEQNKGPPGFPTDPHLHNRMPNAETDQIQWGSGFTGNEETRIPPVPPALYNSLSGDHSRSELVAGEASIPALGVSSMWSDVPLLPYFDQNSDIPPFQPGGYDISVEGMHFNRKQYSPEPGPTVPIDSQGTLFGAETAHTTYGSINQLYTMNHNENRVPQVNGYPLTAWEFQPENATSLVQSGIPDLESFDVCNRSIQRAHVDHSTATQGLDQISKEEVMHQMTNAINLPHGVSPEQGDFYLQSTPFQPPENQAFFPAPMPQELYSGAPEGTVYPQSLQADMAPWHPSQLSTQTTQLNCTPLFGPSMGGDGYYNINDEICGSAIHHGISNQDLPGNIFFETQGGSHSPGHVEAAVMYRSGLTEEEIANDPYGLGFMDSKWSRESSPGIVVAAAPTREELTKASDQDDGSEGGLHDPSIKSTQTLIPNTTPKQDETVATQETSKTSESRKRSKNGTRALAPRKSIGALKGKKPVSSSKRKAALSTRNSRAKSVAVVAPAIRSKRDRTDMSKSTKTLPPQISSTGKTAGRPVQSKLKKVGTKEDNNDPELAAQKIRKLVSSVHRPILKDITQKQPNASLQGISPKKGGRLTGGEHESSAKFNTITSSTRKTSRNASPPYHVPMSTYVQTTPTSQPPGFSENTMKPAPFVVGAKPNPGFSRKAPLLEGLKEYLPPGQVPLITRSPRKSKLSAEKKMPTSRLVKSPGQSILLESRSELAEVEGRVFDSVGGASIGECVVEGVVLEKEAPLPFSEATEESPFRNVGCWNTVATPAVIKFDLLRKINTDRVRQ